MYNLVTLSDKNYLKQGYLLHESLLEHGGDFQLHYLCLDKETYNEVSLWRNALPYTYEEIDSEILLRHRQMHTWEEHCWGLGSYFLHWLRSNKVGDMMYIDADIFFYGKLDKIYEEIGDSSIGIITHRFLEKRERKTGEYNVGIIYFKDDEAGNECLNWWADVVMDRSNPHFETHGTCGDQKYLELFLKFWTDDVLIIDEIGHAAPWNAHAQHKEGDHIFWQGHKQPFIFYHFSHFNWDRKGWRSRRGGEWYPERVPWAKELYQEYFQKIKNVDI